MKTLAKENKDGATVWTSEFKSFIAAYNYVQEKTKQGYLTSFPTLDGNVYVVYTWQK